MGTWLAENITTLSMIMLEERIIAKDHQSLDMTGSFDLSLCVSL